MFFTNALIIASFATAVNRNSAASPYRQMRAIQASSVDLFICVGSSGEANHFLRRVFHPVSDREVETGVSNDALTFFYIRSLETHHDRNFHAQVSCRFNDAARYHVATHDAAEDIDQNCSNIFIRQQNPKRSFNSFLRRATADVKEVCRLATGE